MPKDAEKYTPLDIKTTIVISFKHKRIAMSISRKWKLSGETNDDEGDFKDDRSASPYYFEFLSISSEICAGLPSKLHLLQGTYALSILFVKNR